MEEILRHDTLSIEFDEIFDALESGTRVQTRFWKGMVDNPSTPARIEIPQWSVKTVFIHITSEPELGFNEFSHLLAALDEIDVFKHVGFTADKRFPKGWVEIRVIFVEGEPEMKFQALLMGNR